MLVSTGKKALVAVATAAVMAVGGLTAASTASAGAPGPDCRKTVAHKSLHPCVKVLERLLKNCGYQVRPDRYFSRATRRQVKHFQSLHGLKADGIVGPKTWRMLDRYRCLPYYPINPR